MQRRKLCPFHDSNISKQGDVCYYDNLHHSKHGQQYICNLCINEYCQFIPNNMKPYYMGVIKIGLKNDLNIMNSSKIIATERIIFDSNSYSIEIKYGNKDILISLYKGNLIKEYKGCKLFISNGSPLNIKEIKDLISEARLRAFY
jgi:hypothetical protein